MTYIVMNCTDNGNDNDVECYYEIKTISEYRGTGAVATKDIDPGVCGVTIISEKPLLSSPLRGSPEDKSGNIYPPTMKKFIQEQFWTDYWAYKKLSVSDQEKVKSLYYDKASAEEYLLVLKKVILATKAKNEKQSHKDFDWEEFVIVSMIVRLNCVLLPNKCRGLFHYCCRLNHSCKPNCVWETVTDGKTSKIQRQVRLIQEVKCGDEFTVDYYESYMLPTHIRRQQLHKYKSFYCQCRRCTDPVDYTRKFPCYNCKLGYHVVCNSNPNPNNTTETCYLMNCSKCKKEPIQSYEDMVLLEKETEKEINELSALIGNDTPVDFERIMSIQPPHKYHYLAAHNLFIIQSNQYKNNGLMKEHAQSCLNRYECYCDILGKDYPNSQTALAAEFAADAYSLCEEPSLAIEYYQTAIRMFHITTGFDSMSSQNVIEKLLNFRKQQQIPNREGDTTTCAICATKANKKCSRCNAVSYCCRDHQKVDWKLHKLQCKK